MTNPEAESGSSGDPIEELLRRIGQGDTAARGQLFELLYEDLHDRAKGFMRTQGDGHTLQPTALVNEAFMKLAGHEGRRQSGPIESEGHFLAVASLAMRQVLVDSAKAKNRMKRRAPGQRVLLEQLYVEQEEEGLDIEALDKALADLATFDSALAKGVELRLFGGSTFAEAAAIIGMKPRTFERKWKSTLEWLRARMTQL